MRFTAVNDFSINRWSSRWLQSHATDRAFSRRVTFDPFTHGTKEITLDLRGINARFSLAMAARWNRDELRLARIPNLGQAWIILRLHLRSFRKLGQLPFTTLQVMTCMRRSKSLTSFRKRGTCKRPAIRRIRSRGPSKEISYSGASVPTKARLNVTSRMRSFRRISVAIVFSTMAAAVR